MKVYTRKLIQTMWARGMPTTDARFANLYRAAMKAGLDEAQAFELVKDAYNAANGYEWQLAGAGEAIFKIGCGLRRATVQRVAKEHPRSKCAEDLAAEREGRPSRWVFPEVTDEQEEPDLVAHGVA